MAKKRLRGVTLLEITIVMAVTAIMVTGIVSMCVSVNGISARSAQVSDVIGAVADCKKSLADWVSYFDKDGVTIELVGTDENKTDLSAKNSVGEEVGSFKLDSDNDHFVADFGSGTLKTSNASTVFHVSFDEYTQTANGQRIIRCTLKYTLTQSSGKQLTTEQSFVVSTRRQTV